MRAESVVSFRQLEVFYTIMTHGTVTAAARELGVTQPAVTATLRQAEQNLNIQLFRRESGRLVPTDEARVLFDEARRAHEALAAFTDLAANFDLSLGGRVRIGAVPAISQELLPDAIARFARQHSGFQYHVATLDSTMIIEQLKARRSHFDLGFALGDDAASGLSSKLIGDVNVFGVFPADWELPAADPLDLQQVADRPYVAGFDHTTLGVLTRQMFADCGVEPLVAARTETHLLAGALVQRGIGYSLLDSLTIRALLHSQRADSITVRQVAGTGSIPVLALYPARRPLNTPATLFIECFQAAFDRLEAAAEAQTLAAVREQHP